MKTIKNKIVIQLHSRFSLAYLPKITICLVVTRRTMGGLLEFLKQKFFKLYAVCTVG